MKRILVAGILSGALLFLLAACGDDSEEKTSDLIYGQIVKINETAVTVEQGNYNNDGKFNNSGKTVTYNLPEMVFYDDFSTGDIVAVLFDGDDATMLTNTGSVLCGLGNGSQVGTELEFSESGADDSKPGNSESQRSEYKYLSAVSTVDGSKKIANNNLYESNTEDVSAILVKNAGALTIGGGIINKAGDASNISAVDSYGLNAALAVISGSGVNIKDSVIKSNARGGDGVMIGGSKSKITSQNGAVTTYGDYSRGLAVFDGGAAEFNGTDISTSGENSPCIYSSGNISLTNSSVNAGKSSVAAIEGKSNLFFKNCKLTGSGDKCLYFCRKTVQKIFFLCGRLVAGNSEIQYNGDGPMFKVKGTNAVAVMSDTDLIFGSGVLAEVAGGSNNGATVAGKLILKGLSQKFTGRIKCDKYSEFKLILMEGSIFTGAVDTENTAQYSKVYLSAGSKWNVTEDSYVRSLTDENKTCSNIISNGHNIYYSPDNPANEWLGGKTTDLPGGGELIPLG